MRFQKATQRQLTGLQNALGSYSTVHGTAEHSMFESMHGHGWVRELSLTAHGARWQLSPAGLDLAYPNKVPFPRRMSFG